MIFLFPRAPSISAWISNHMPSEVWDEITYPFPNFNGCTVEVWEWVSNFVPHFVMDLITYPCWDWSETTFSKKEPHMISHFNSLKPCHLFSAKPLPEPMLLTFCQLDPWEQTSLKLLYFFQNLWKFVLKGQIGKKSASVEVMACPWAGNKPLPESVMA